MAGGIIGVLTNVDNTGNEQEMYPVTKMEAVDGLNDEFAKVRKESSDVAASIRNEVSAVNSKTESNLAASKQYTDGKHATYTATLSTGWSGSAAPYTQEISISGILASDIPHIYPVYSDTLATAIAQQEAWNLVCRAKASAGKITFYCFEDKPTTAIPIQIEVNR